MPDLSGRVLSPPVVIHGRLYSPGPDGRWYDAEGGSFTQWQVESYVRKQSTEGTDGHQ